MVENKIDLISFPSFGKNMLLNERSKSLMRFLVHVES